MVIKADLPAGVKLHDIKITLEDSNLVLRGEKTEEKSENIKGYRVQGFPSFNFVQV